MGVGWYILIGIAAALLLTLVSVLVRAARLKRERTSPIYPRAADPEVCRHAADSLGELLRFQTVSPGAGGDYTEWVRLRDYLKWRYPRAHSTMEREVVGLHSLLYRWPAPRPTGPPLLFCGHLDVVPAEEGWQVGPFEGIISDGYVWGRGALDGKQVVACLLECAESLINSGFVPKRDIYFAFGHDNEVGGEDGSGEIARVFARRHLHFEMILDEGGVLKRGVLSLRRPVAEICVAEKGAAYVRVTAQSNGGHASEPERRTALGAVCEAISRTEFKKYPSRVTPHVHAFLKLLAPNLSFGWRLYIANRWLLARHLAAFEPSWARTTITPTALHAGKAANALPTKAEATLDIRLLHGETCDDVLRYLRDLFIGLDVSLMAVSSHEASKISDYQCDAFASIAEIVRTVFGPVPVIPSLLAQTTSALHYEMFSDNVYRFSPFILSQAEMAGVHGRDERVSVDSLGLAMAFYGRLITHMAGGKQQLS
ncbi:MAG: M20/M25/M40 family metallo-hydrolase [Oscillospiraceae bacterium]|nr:M20/M25/M40 family metallo-hydrolase [Oscillospiraceae bacterium]